VCSVEFVSYCKILYPEAPVLNENLSKLQNIFRPLSFHCTHFPVCTVFLATDPENRGMTFLRIVKNNVSRTIKLSRDADINWKITLNRF
jgi:hypothetical protein